jgi:hypothetical protein
MPAAFAIAAASTLVSIPPLPTDDPVPPISTWSRSLASSTNGMRRLLSRLGGPSYSASTSVSRTSASAETSSETSAASRSLSPNRISCVATVSFSLMTGTIPSSRRRSRVRRALV